MTVDEILASGRYTDRRGREWEHKHRDGRWFYATGGQWFEDGRRVLDMVHTPEMRLLIERDMHRDECPSLIACENHPVPCVTIAGGPYGCFHVNPADTSDEDYVAHECSHERAMDAAYRLAVGK